MLICYTVDSNGETILLSTHVLVTAHERSTLGVSYLFYITLIFDCKCILKHSKGSAFNSHVRQKCLKYI